MSRFAKTNIVIGATGSGKTTMLQQLLEGQDAIFYTGSPRDPALASMPEADIDRLGSVMGSHKFHKLSTYDHRKALFAIAGNYFNGNVVMDDIGSIMSSNIGKQFQQVMGGVRHNGNDLFFCFWHVNDVPPFLYRMASTISIFKQGDTDIQVHEGKFPRLDEFKKARDWVQDLNPVEYKHSFAFIVTDPLDSRSKEPFTGCKVKTEH